MSIKHRIEKLGKNEFRSCLCLALGPNLCNMISEQLGTDWEMATYYVLSNPSLTYEFVILFSEHEREQDIQLFGHY